MTRSLRLLAPLALLLLLALPATAQTTFTVTTTADPGDGTCDAAGIGDGCTLREAITAANTAAGDNVIDFADGMTGTINLTGALPNLSSNIEINGPGAGMLTVRRDTGGDYRIFFITSDHTVALRGLTMSNGTARFGGGIINSGALTIENSTLSGNSAGSGSGGGISNSGTLTISTSTLSGNSAGSGSGGISNGENGLLTISYSTLSGNSAATVGGGIGNRAGMVTVTNSTFSGNTSGSVGGGIDSQEGTVMVTNSTFSGNSATNVGGGIRNDEATLTVTNSTFSGNNAGSGGAIGNLDGALTVGNTVFSRGLSGQNISMDGGTVTSDGYNVCDDACGLSGTGDLVSTDPLLGPLADNGGPTLTHALLGGSPAIDLGGTCGPTDQRGFDAPTDGDSDSSADCDAGSIEAPTLVLNQPPVADAGPDQTVIAGQTVTLDGTSSTDPDDDALTFAWTLGSAPLTGADTASPMFCAATPGAYTAELVVNDGTVDSESDAVTVTALSVDDAVAGLIADIESVLSRRDARALTNRLTQALRHLDRGRSADAMFRTVKTRIGTYVRIGKLTQTQADELTAALDAITSVLASPCSDTAAVQGDDLLASAMVSTEVVFGLAAPYPNPTSGRATVAFSVEDATDARLAVYDALGREVAVLLEGSVPAGRHELAFDGAELVAGTYLVRLSTAEGLTASHRLTRLR